MFVVPMSQIPLDLYTPALPQMVVDLRASPTSMQHTVAAYLLGMSLAFVPVGVVADARAANRSC
ncbi:putative drug resistance efflux domain protein [Mycobacterium kansasii]|uniref:Putative drug resistance efflux domain protein n=1 Tax=Mycobacterium kansasii TaxID=1768 RepID=A0A1V3X677_MYCKA|nr:putative drug resistance efflux domain protein [Mycobacterium kansasii]